MRKSISSSGRMAGAGPSASRVPYQRISTIISPPNISLTGLVSEEKRWARNTRLR